jgi:hypothetical protein
MPSRLRMATARTPTLQIFGTPITSAVQNSSYTGFTCTASGGSGGNIFSVLSGTLPPGVTLNAVTGVVAGTPTTVAVYAAIVIRVTDILGHTADLTPFTITVASGSSMPATQSISVGALQLRGHGGHNCRNTGGALTITSDPSGLFSIDSYNQLVLSGTYGTAPPALTGPYTVVVSNGVVSSTITVSVVANAYFVQWRAADDAGTNQLTAVLSLTAAALGQTCYIRDGAVINPTAARFDIGRGVTAFVGTWSGSNYFRITPETKWGATWWWVQINGGSRPNQYISIDGVYCTRHNLAHTDGAATGVVNLILGASFCKITNCYIIDDPTATNPGDSDLCTGITGSNGQTDIVITDNVITGVHHGTTAQGHNLYVVGNELSYFWEDGIHAGNCWDATLSWNFLYNNRYFHSGGLHGDCIQIDNAGITTGTITKLADVIGNIAVRGLGDPGYGTGAILGIFDTMVPTSGLVCRGNIYDGTFQIGVNCYKLTSPDVSFNTLIQDTASVSVPGVSDPPTTFFRSTVGGVSRYNAVSQAAIDFTPTTPITVTNNVTVTTTAGLAGAYTSPTFNVTPTSRSQVVGWFGAKAGGTLDPAVTGFPYWAGADHYVDYVNRTTSFPI